MCSTTGYLLLFGIVCGLLTGCGSQTSTATSALRVAPPPAGTLYHGVYPGGVEGNEDDVTAALTRAYEEKVGKQVAWVYFSHNWFQGRAFPRATTQWIHDLGSTPYIRLMLRSSTETDIAEPLYTLDAIIRGDFDGDLAAWGRAAAACDYPLLVEYGTECNGQWFAWNGAWNGGAVTTGFGDPTMADGPERFIAAYRHIVTVIRDAGARNITWVFHVNIDDDPDVAWNRFERYYPGDDVVDWIGVSCYGAQTPLDDWTPQTFTAQMDAAYPRLAQLAGSKPIMVVEFGCTAGHPLVNQAVWAQDALQNLLERRWPHIAGFAWWNEHWQNDDTAAHDSNLCVQDNPALATTFSATLATYGAWVQQRPVER